MFESLSMIGYETGLIVLVAILILFGGKKIPELMRGIGQGVGELKKGMDDAQRHVMISAQQETPQPQMAATTATTPVVPATDSGRPVDGQVVQTATPQTPPVS